MRDIKISMVKLPVLGNMILFGFRVYIALKHFYYPVINLIIWLFKSNETTNITFDLEARNIKHLTSLISDVTNTDFDIVSEYIKEIENDNYLKNHIRDETLRSNWSFMADEYARFGRRVGWYAFVRILKPKIIVETGVDKGLGACVLTAALKRNKEEGYEGRYYGTDIKDKAGYLLSGDYEKFGDILYGDSIESLNALDCEIDLFINDSDHSADYEFREYEVISDKLSPDAFILGDNCDLTDALLNFSIRRNRRFIFFKEKSLNHWHPGSGIGISFKRSVNFKGV